jgi:ParB-like chromosome segregation protein Spo0J
MQITPFPLEKLIPYAGNPRKNDQAVEQVASAIKRFGFRVPVLAKSDGSLIDGHLRIKAAKKLKLTEVPVIICDDLSDADIKALRISINRMADLAEWDTELLGAELEGLKELGIGSEDVGFTDELLEELGVLSNNDGKDDTLYSTKVEIPVYEPQGPKPSVKELYDTSQADSRMREIKESNLPDEVKQFLSAAAQRHVVFRFDKIAEFYAHSDKATQELFESSGLVIVDINRALEDGYVEFSEKVREIYLGDKEL